MLRISDIKLGTDDTESDLTLVTVPSTFTGERNLFILGL